MAHLVFKNPLSREEKLALMREDSAYDVADDDASCIPDFSAIRREIKAKPTPPKVPKTFLSNDCVFNCAYCGCRAGNEQRNRYANTPAELAQICVEEAVRNKHGVFISSGIFKNADYTTELIIETLKRIRNEHMYKGYVHAKIMPGTDMGLIRLAGLYANRLSVNIEVAKEEGYRRVAKQKTRSNILTPMRHISELISAAHVKSRYSPRFATSQTTQMMAGSTNESDYEILRLSKAMYNKYRLARVYYTAFGVRERVKGYSDLAPVRTPVWRMKRLYQADRLMQLYGFTPEEIAPEAEANLIHDLDPKAAWALRNIHLYPIEVNKADYEELIRIPGIGTTYAARIIKARKYCKITHEALRALGVSLKRSRHFLTANGKYHGEKCESLDIYRGLLASPLDEAKGCGANSVEDC
ncbi:MAG: helix-hairpin-helix domain-containing protein [Defluviitaleaceae bacterium]|nr:helix-hairpin-helix domain-containing protein [Defluviitaleaceae bacterium]